MDGDLEGRMFIGSIVICSLVFALPIKKGLKKLRIKEMPLGTTPKA